MNDKAVNDKAVNDTAMNDTTPPVEKPRRKPTKAQLKGHIFMGRESLTAPTGLRRIAIREGRRPLRLSRRCTSAAHP